MTRPLLADIRRVGETRIGRRASRYSFCWHDDVGYQLNVEHTGGRHDDRWAIRRGGSWCLARSGKWAFEPSPSNRDADWLDRHRFTRDEAVLIALRIEHDTGPGALWVNVTRDEHARLDTITRRATVALLEGDT